MSSGNHIQYTMDAGTEEYRWALLIVKYNIGVSEIVEYTEILLLFL